MNFNLPYNVKFIINTLRSKGYEAYAVGGCVRDTILNRRPNDWDITTSALPLEVKALFKKTIDTGLKHGTVTVLINGTGYEVTTYRIDGIYNDCRHPESVTFTSNLAEDLRRRDFTINAFVYNEEDGVIDLFDGLSDLDNKIIRCVGVPEERFTEDALRILRAVRFAAQLKFTIDEETMRAAKLLAPNLVKVSAERIHVELEKLLVSANPDYISLLSELNIDRYILPALYNVKATCEEKQRMLYALTASVPDKYLRWSILCSYITKTSNQPCIDATELMRSLKSDNNSIDYITKFISLRDFSFENSSEYELRLLLNKLGDKDYKLFVEFLKANKLISGPSDSSLNDNEYVNEIKVYNEMLSDIEFQLKTIIDNNECTFIKQLAINGRDLIAQGFPQGKELGRILEGLLDAVMHDQSLNTSEKLLELAKQI